MKKYIIVVDQYESQGGLFRYSHSPKFETISFDFYRNEREYFIKKWEYFLSEDMYYDNIRCFYVDFDLVTIVEITDRLEETKNNI